MQIVQRENDIKGGNNMFGFLKGKSKEIIIGSPVKGKAVPISQVNDPTFAEEILGKGVAIMPEDGKICAPAAGEIGMVFDTMHAFSDRKSTRLNSSHWS